MRTINVTLTPCEEWPGADDRYEAFVRAQLVERYPDAEVDVSTSIGMGPKVFAYPEAGKPHDEDVSRDLRELISYDWWDDFCAENEPDDSERDYDPDEDRTP